MGSCIQVKRNDGENSVSPIQVSCQELLLFLCVVILLSAGASKATFEYRGDANNSVPNCSGSEQVQGNCCRQGKEIEGK